MSRKSWTGTIRLDTIPENRSVGKYLRVGIRRHDGKPVAVDMTSTGAGSSRRAAGCSRAIPPLQMDKEYVRKQHNMGNYRTPESQSIADEEQ